MDYHAINLISRNIKVVFFYPDDAEDQKRYNRLMAGLMKEGAAMH